MRVVDIHVHTFPEKIAASALNTLQSKSHTRPFTNGTINGLCASMREAGVTSSVLQPVATRAEQVTRINDNAIKINTQAKEKGIYSFGAMHPEFLNYNSELTRIKAAGICGIKLHPVYQGVSIDDERYIKILARAFELGLIVLIHAGWDIGFPGNDYAMPWRISEALRASGLTSSSRVILAHMGGWRAWDEACEIFADVESVYIDTAFSLGRCYSNNDGYYKSVDECKMLNSEKFMTIIKSFGAERVLFGSDSPWASQLESVKAINNLDLTEHEKNLILYENAERLVESLDPACCR